MTTPRTLPNAVAPPTIEKDERGWWVRCLDGNQREVRVGPFTRKADVTSFILKHWGLM